jgi:aspartate/methionine/tyrosine aminotransferase
MEKEQRLVWKGLDNFLERGARAVDDRFGTSVGRSVDAVANFISRSPGIREAIDGLPDNLKELVLDFVAEHVDQYNSNLDCNILATSPSTIFLIVQEAARHAKEKAARKDIGNGQWGPEMQKLFVARFDELVTELGIEGLDKDKLVSIRAAAASYGPAGGYPELRGEFLSESKVENLDEGSVSVVGGGRNEALRIVVEAMEKVLQRPNKGVKFSSGFADIEKQHATIGLSKESLESEAGVVIIASDADLDERRGLLLEAKAKKQLVIDFTVDNYQYSQFPPLRNFKETQGVEIISISAESDSDALAYVLASDPRLSKAINTHHTKTKGTPSVPAQLSKLQGLDTSKINVKEKEVDLLEILATFYGLDRDKMVYTPGSNRQAMSLYKRAWEKMNNKEMKVVTWDRGWTYNDIFNENVAYAEVESDENGKAIFTAEAIIKTIEETGANTVVINNPNNATGQIIPKAEIEKVLKYAAENGITVIDDMAYPDMVYEEGHEIGSQGTVVSIAQEMGIHDKLDYFYTQAFSKTDCQPGTRSAFAQISDESILELYNKLNKFNNRDPLAVAMLADFFTQNHEKVKEKYKERNEDAKNRIKAMSSAFDKCREDDSLRSKMDEYKIIFNEPEAALYPTITVKNLPSKLGSEKLAFSLVGGNGVDDFTVAMTPAKAFARGNSSKEWGRTSFRLTIGGNNTPEQIAKMMPIVIKRLIESIDQLKDNPDGDVVFENGRYELEVLGGQEKLAPIKEYQANDFNRIH